MKDYNVVVMLPVAIPVTAKNYADAREEGRHMAEQLFNEYRADAHEHPPIVLKVVDITLLVEQELVTA